MRIAVIGSGISGLSAAWLMAQHGVEVTLLEHAARPGGHSNTVSPVIDGQSVPVDTGFIVYNPATYPNLTEMFHHLNIATNPTNMSFSVSSASGLEYGGQGLDGLFAQRRNLLRPRFWSMLRDIKRFYADATQLNVNPETTLFDLLAEYSEAFAEDHLLPMASAIWSTDVTTVGHMQARSFINFFDNHGLLQLRDRPPWYSVQNGSISYVQKMLATPGIRLELNAKVSGIQRSGDGVMIAVNGHVEHFDQVVLATHADQAIALLDNPTTQEIETLGHFKYSASKAYLHTDPCLMPRSKRAWASWNYLDRGEQGLCVSYWMNRLQRLVTDTNVFVTLNPSELPRSPLAELDYEHPILNSDTACVQKRLWDLQGTHRTWFCGAYFGHGFHEDGLQAGLAVAEEITGKERPWKLAEPNSRISAQRQAMQVAA